MPDNITPPPVAAAAPVSEVDKTIRDGKRGSQLLRMNIQRTKEGGLVLEVQSDVNFAEAFAAGRAGRTGSFTLGGVACIESRVFQLPTGRAVHFNQTDIFYKDNRVNFSVLMAQGLDHGVRFKFGNYPMSAEALREFAGEMKALVRDIWISYLKPVDIEVLVIAKVSEKETQ